ncbi:MAG TPA: ABC transporter permease [Dongiaceae bacterium]|nr:ABC transporter permease [Dongiaceae bacterium]
MSPLAAPRRHAPGYARGPWLRILRLLAWTGRFTRRRLNFILTLAALSGGVAIDACRPATWRRTTRAEFSRVLRQALGGALVTIILTASLIGLGMVFQAIYWLGAAGQEGSIGTVLVTILMREIIPVLVGLILLGRSGSVILIEIGGLQAGGQIDMLRAQGIDPFTVLIVPRGVAFALAAYTLGIIFILTALLTGFVAGSLTGAVNMSIWSFLDNILTAMRPTDFAIFPVKLLLIGLLVAITACLTAVNALPQEDTSRLMPRGFVRGLLAILMTSGLLSLAI